MDQVYWSVLFEGFVYIAIYKSFEIHEDMTGSVINAIGSDHLWIFFFSWVIPAVAMLLLTGLIFLIFFIKFWKRAGYTSCLLLLSILEEQWVLKQYFSPKKMTIDQNFLTFFAPTGIFTHSVVNDAELSGTNRKYNRYPENHEIIWQEQL